MWVKSLFLRVPSPCWQRRAWWAKNGAALARLPNFSAFQVPQEASLALARLADRSMQLTCTVQDGHVYFANGDESLEVAVDNLLVPPAP